MDEHNVQDEGIRSYKEHFVLQQRHSALDPLPRWANAGSLSSGPKF